METGIIEEKIKETEKKQISAARKTVFILVGYMCLVFISYYVIISLLSPAKKITEINIQFGYKPLNNSPVDESIFHDSAFIKMNRNKAWLQSRIIMAETDSICLAVNLADSTVNLEINGVNVLKVKISKERISKVFDKADEYAVSSMLSSPFTIDRNIATIKKDPLMIKMAPKDTSEYKPDILPDTTHLEPVNYIMEMGNGVRLYVYQEVGDEPGDPFSLFLFDIKDRLRNIWNILKSISVLKVPEYHPFIKIRLPKVDAKFIYRAVPVHGQVAVHM